MNAAELLQEADRLCSLGDKVNAERLYGELIEKHSASDSTETRHCVALAYNNIGQLKYLRVDFDEAIVDYSRAIEVDANLAVAYYNRGQIHYRVGEFLFYY